MANHYECFTCGRFNEIPPGISFVLCSFCGDRVTDDDPQLDVIKEPNMQEPILKVCPNEECDIDFLETNFKRCPQCRTKLKPYIWKPQDRDVPPHRPLSRMELEELNRHNTQPKLLTASSLSEAVSKGSDKEWVGESDCDIKGCPIAPAPKIRIPFRLYRTWQFLCHRFDTEWAAYLKGEISDDGLLFELSPDGMYFPKQACTGGHVSVDHNVSMQEGTIAAVHSNVNMAAFFSKEDENHWNHPIELVVNRKGDVEAVARMKLECGRFQRQKANVALIGCEEEMCIEKVLSSVLTVDKAPPERTVTVFRSDGSSGSPGTHRYAWKNGHPIRLPD